MTRRAMLWLVVRFAIGIALVVWLSRSGVIEWSSVGSLLAHPAQAALALALIMAAAVATAGRLCVVAAPAGLRISLGSSMRLALIGTAFNVFMPGSAGGDVVRFYWALRDQKGQRTEVATILVLDRVIGLVAMLLFPLLTALVFPAVARLHPAVTTILTRAAGLAAVAVLAAFVFWRPSTGPWIARRLASLPLAGLTVRATEALRVYRAFPGTLVMALVLSFSATMMGMLAMLLLVRVVGGTGSAQVMLMLLPVGFLINALPLTPGGLGVGEIAMDRLFGMAGLTGGAAALIGWRLLSLVPASIGLALYVQGRADVVAPVPGPTPPEAVA